MAPGTAFWSWVGKRGEKSEGASLPAWFTEADRREYVRLGIQGGGRPGMSLRQGLEDLRRLDVCHGRGQAQGGAADVAEPGLVAVLGLAFWTSDRHTYFSSGPHFFSRISALVV